MDEILLVAETKMDEAIQSMEKRFLNVRAGRANAGILDGVMVSYYGILTNTYENAHWRETIRM